MGKERNKRIENAEEIIERFGGIRPMAKKMDVAVTTIQGWKKRNTIPGNRRRELLKAAEENDVDVSDILNDAFLANENKLEGQGGFASDSVSGNAPLSMRMEEPEKAGNSKKEHDKDTGKGKAPEATAWERELKKSERKVFTSATVLNLVLLALGLGAVFVLLWPRGYSEDEAARIAMLENQVQQLEAELEEAQSNKGFFDNVIPEALDEKISRLQEQARTAQENIGSAMEEAQKLSSTVLSDNENLQGRVTRLEEYLESLTGSAVLSDLVARYQNFQQTDVGTSLLDTTMEELHAVLSSVQTGEETDTPEGQTNLINQTLERAREQSTALSKSFENVPAQDLKAAALLLGMTQFRSSLNRDNQPFEEDLVVLKKLVGEDDPEFLATLDRLAPHAESGVLTSEGLTTEFKTIAGDAVVASLKGEDVSIRERAVARLNEVLSLEKDGELVTGTETQVKLAKTEKLLEAGDIEGALIHAQSLQGPEADVLSSWISQAQATLAAQRVKSMIGQALGKTGPKYTATGSAVGGKLIRDEELGINVFRRDDKPAFDGLNLKNQTP